jgi:hypothetical protein
VVASRGATIAGLPLIGQSSMSPPRRWTASRMALLRPTSMVLISMCTVPGRRVVSVPASPQTMSDTAAVSGTIDSTTSDRLATSAAESASLPPASTSSGDP